MTTRPLLLDLFCGAGGAAVGYHRAGFDVVGVDNRPQPRYPFPMIVGDALLIWQASFERRFGKFDAIHASPPCQDHMRSPQPGKQEHGTGWLLGATREMLQAIGLPWVIENVPGAPMRANFKLCGCLFGLPNLRRERWFETSPQLYDLRPPCHHADHAMSVTGTGYGTRLEREHFGRWPNRQDWERCMGIDWMKPEEIVLAIPPAYTEYIGRQLLSVI